MYLLCVRVQTVTQSVPHSYVCGWLQVAVLTDDGMMELVRPP